MRLRTVFCAIALSLVCISTANAGQLFAPGYFPDQVSVFEVDANGVPAVVPGSPFPIGAFPAGNGLGAIAFTPDGTRAVASYYFGGGVQGLNVAANGAVTVAGPIVGSFKGVQPAVTPDGRFAYQPVGGATKAVAGYAVAADGTLSPATGSPNLTSQSINDVVVSPDGHFLYAADGSAILRFAINADGSLTAQPATPASGASALLFASDGKHIVVQSGSNTLLAYAINPDGSVGSAGAPVVVGSTGLYINAISADGRNVFAVDYNGDTLGDSKYSVNTYRLGSDGSLTLAGASNTLPFRGRGIGVSPDGRFVYLGTDDGKLAYAPLDANGVATAAFKEGGAWPSGEPTPFVFKPVFAPTADFKKAPVSKVLTMRFDAAGSSSPDGSVDQYGWNFGDGSVQDGAASVATHKFAKAGRYSVTLTASNDGCADRNLFTGHMMVCNGAPTAAKTVLVDTPPWITSLKLSKNKIKFKLTEKASVSFYAQKPVKGRAVGSKCKKQTAKNKKAKKCTLWVRASKTFRARGKAGKTNSTKFAGRSKLSKGSYRLYAVATDSAKGRGPAATAKFKIKR